MKQLLFTLCLTFIVSLGLSQNGGQANENNSVKITLIAKANGYYAGVLSKQSCQSAFKYYYTNANDVIDFNLPAGGYHEFYIGQTITGKIKAKANTQCSNTDYGWVEINLTAMPLKFSGNPVVTYDRATDYITIKVPVTEVQNVKHILLRASFDGGKTKKQIALLWLDYANPNQTYSYKIKRSELLKIKAL